MKRAASNKREKTQAFIFAFLFSFVPTSRNSSRGLDFNANILSIVAVVVTAAGVVVASQALTSEDEKQNVF